MEYHEYFKDVPLVAIRKAGTAPEYLGELLWPVRPEENMLGLFPQLRVL